MPRSAAVYREAPKNAQAIVDLRSAAGVLRAYAAILESNVRMAEMRARKAAKSIQQNAGIIYLTKPKAF